MQMQLLYFQSLIVFFDYNLINHDTVAWSPLQYCMHELHCLNRHMMKLLPQLLPPRRSLCLSALMHACMKSEYECITTLPRPSHGSYYITFIVEVVLVLVLIEVVVVLLLVIIIIVLERNFPNIFLSLQAYKQSVLMRGFGAHIIIEYMSPKNGECCQFCSKMDSTQWATMMFSFYLFCSLVLLTLFLATEAFMTSYLPLPESAVLRNGTFYWWIYYLSEFQTINYCAHAILSELV